MELHKINKVIVVSAINFFEGGPLSILMDCLNELSSTKYSLYQIIILVHKKELFEDKIFPNNIVFKEFPKSRKHYFYRLYYEYIYFKKISKKLNVHLWFSLHDISPRVEAKVKSVYCHNPTPFYKIQIADIRYPNLILSSFFYKYLYQINIRSNDYVIVQQMWMKEIFCKIFNIELNKVIVASPIHKLYQSKILENKDLETNKVFFFPCLPRPFKNIDVLGRTCQLLHKFGIFNYQLLLTIDGTENTYSKRIVERYKDIPQIKFLGRITRTEVFEIYQKCDVLLFPSLLETWGLPMSEFKQFNKPMFASNLPYAKETVGNYHKAIFLHPNKSQEWASYMQKIIEDKRIIFEHHEEIKTMQPKADNWSEIFDILLKK